MKSAVGGANRHHQPQGKIMHTTEEATTLWCPMVRIGVLPSHGGPAGVSDPTTEFHGNCIAERCAMWRWDGSVKLPEKRGAELIWSDEDDPQKEPARQVTLRGKIKLIPEWLVWVPVSGKGDDTDGGYWIEPQERVDAEHAAAVAEAKTKMRGYCGLAGSVVR